MRKTFVTLEEFRKFETKLELAMPDLLYDPTKFSIATGDDAVLDDIFSYQIYNKIKNHWRAATEPSDKQGGMIWQDSDDDIFRGYDGAAWDALLNASGSAVLTGTMQWDKGADIASANTLVPGSDGNYFDVTGTTAILAINAAQSQPGTGICLHFDAILTLTHHATDLILPGGANITTAAGDEAIFIEYATDDWRCICYTKASGEAVVGAGGVELKVISFTRDSAVASGTQAVTGVGFTPKVAIFHQTEANFEAPSWGMDDGTNHYCNTTNRRRATRSIWNIQSLGNDEYEGYVSAWGADGCTITWTRTGTPTGTLTIDALFIG